jgi:hypothetical protein
VGEAGCIVDSKDKEAESDLISLQVDIGALKKKKLKMEDSNSRHFELKVQKT